MHLQIPWGGSDLEIPNDVNLWHPWRNHLVTKGFLQSFVRPCLSEILLLFFYMKDLEFAGPEDNGVVKSVVSKLDCHDIVDFCCFYGAMYTC